VSKYSVDFKEYMKPEILSTASETLTNLFFRNNNAATDFLSMRTMEYYISDLDLLSDATVVSAELEELRRRYRPYEY
jgi:hypothetical protein